MLAVLKRLVAVAALALFSAAAAGACTRSYTLAPADGSIPLGRDAGVPGRPDGGGPCREASAVDVLFMVDNSSSMGEEQASLAVQFPRLVSALATGDRDGDGIPDFLPIRDLHFGVVTPDMGNGGFAVPTCPTTFGDDGILVTRGNTSRSGCAASYPPFVAFTPPGDAARFGADFACVAILGTGGCGFEQPLEATLKALTPSTSPITFGMGTPGHADRENAGFARPDSLLAVVLLTDEDDCSARDPELFDLSSVTYTGDLATRCFFYPDAVHPVSRYVDGLRALRAARPDLFVLGVIAGVPTDLVADPARTDYDAILADRRMQEDLGGFDSHLLPACNVPGRGLAFPARRLVQVARAFGGQATVQSICQDDLGPAVDAIAARIGDYACARF